MEVIPLGDSALLVRVGKDFEKSSDQSLDDVLATLRQLQAAQIPGVIDLTSAYASVAVFFDPVRVVEAGAPADSVIDWLTEKIKQALARDTKRNRKKSAPRVVEIPVCYQNEFAPDLGDVAQRAGISAEEVTKIHCAPEYRVACVGFTPGFGFLSGLDPKIGDAETCDAARGCSGGRGCDRRIADRCLSNSVAGWLEYYRAHAAANVRCEAGIADAALRRRPRALSLDYTRRIRKFSPVIFLIEPKEGRFPNRPLFVWAASKPPLLGCFS